MAVGMDGGVDPRRRGLADGVDARRRGLAGGVDARRRGLTGGVDARRRVQQIWGIWVDCVQFGGFGLQPLGG